MLQRLLTRMGMVLGVVVLLATLTAVPANAQSPTPEGTLIRSIATVTFTDANTNAYATVADTFYSPDYGKSFAPKSGPLGVDDQYIRSALARVTWQMTSKMKLTAYNDQIDKYRGHNMSAGTDPATAGPWANFDQ